MNGVEQLLEIERIKLLKARYFRFLDTKQWAQWREVFTDDLEAFYEEVAGGPVRQIAEGADAFVEWMSEDMGESTTVHHGHTPEIEMTSAETAAGIWAMSDMVRHPAHHPRPSIVGTGHYHEDYRKGADGLWRIRRFRLVRLTLARGGQPVPPGIARARENL